MLKPIAEPSLSYAQKKAALAKLLRDKVAYPDGTPEKQQEKLCAALADAVITHFRNEPNRAGWFLNQLGETRLVLYPAQSWEGEAIQCVAAPPQEADTDIKHWLHVAADQLSDPAAWQAITDALSHPADKQVTGRQLIIGSGRISDDKTQSVGFEGRFTKREDYDFHGELRHEKKHTAGDLERNGLLRIGLDEANPTKQQEELFEQIKQAGIGWQGQVQHAPDWQPIASEYQKLWQARHEDLLLDKTLAEKTPGRWFRDMCVLCGISTVKLTKVIGAQQAIWSKLQNMPSIPPGNATLHHMRKALSMVLEHATHEGHGVGYMIPAGSSFGLKLIEQRDETGRKSHAVDPEQREAILKKLFKERYVAVPNTVDFAHGLERISRLSAAYRHGAIPQEELVAANLSPRILQSLIKQFGTYKAYPREKKENQALLTFLHSGHTSNQVGYRAAEKILRTINDRHTYVDKETFDLHMQALQYLPTIPSVMTAVPLTRDEAFELAKSRHHNRLGGFLNSYRETLHEKLLDVVQRKGCTKERIRQLEAEETLKGKHFLNDQNPWNLPTGKDGKIRKDVKNYLSNFKARPPLPAPETHWLTLLEAAEKIAMELPLSAPMARMDFDIYRDRPVLGVMTKSIAEENPAMQAMRQTIETALAQRPQSGPYPLVTLPDGENILVKTDARGEIRLLDSEIGHWRGWMQDCARPRGGRARSSPSPF